MEFGQKSDPYREVIEFVEHIYSEAAQNKSNFTDYSCLFCRSEYMDLNLLLYHIEDYHRNQIMDGTFNLQQNFEELIRKKVGTAVKTEDQPDQREQRTLESNQLYQCAKCKITYASVRAITEHVNECTVSVQSVVRSNILAPLPPPPNPNLYGCARCGSRFKLVRQLVVHLHSCFVDCFHDKHKHLLPNLWVEAPNNQHIVINESETNTTLNTTGLWLMSNSPACTTEDNLSKGFWVMPPSNVQPIEIQPIQHQVIQQQAEMVVIPSTHQPNNHQQLQQPQQQQQQQQQQPQQQSMRYVKIEDEIFMVDDTTTPKFIQNTNNVIVRPTTTADENKRKRGRIVPPTPPPLVQTNSMYRQQPTYVNKKSRTDNVTHVPSAAPTQIVYISPPSKVQPKPAPQQRKIPQKPSIPPPPMHQTTYIQQPAPIVPDQIYMEEPTNYVITYDDNTTQIIKPGDELYEQVANSFQYEQTEFQLKKENTIDLTSTNSSSPNVIEETITPDNVIQSPAVAPPLLDCNIDDLSHLDMPIATKTTATVMRRKNEDAFIKSYTSFLESRQITPKS